MDDLRFELLRTILVQQHTLMRRQLSTPSEVENDQKFHKFIEFLERELKKRPEVVRNNFIQMNQAFLYDNPVQE
ncbi:hypothetical protein PVAND_012653 [Polypedilum vanderplanki]|uniref:Uncharacterized protein n=1 Tax=Polypedilum vanderplanki TaxID=319348 RepID=A0A9J6CN45_POLVA|nr:hypothetical protein PVAND_012653 [Polypedilum vanderplanki]